MKQLYLAGGVLLVCMMIINTQVSISYAQSPISIGTIQGVGNDGSMEGQIVTFRGIVTGLHEDQNTDGDIFHTFYVQDLPENADGNPDTSDAIPVFNGRRRPPVRMGDVVLITGRVTEFFDLTEIDDADLQIVVESSGNPLPEPIPLNPPADNKAMLNYYEPFEGMRATVAGTARVVGATFSGCGFSVVNENAPPDRIIRRQDSDPIGFIIPILNHTDVTCDGFPDVKTGDGVAGLVGPLTYNFDQFKIIQQTNEDLLVTESERLPLPVAPIAGENQFSIASFNVENFFDLVDDTGETFEPKPSAGELTLKQTKIAYSIGVTLGCPTLVAIQEVEKESLLLALAEEIAPICGFTYAVSHVASPDARGIDTALLTNPNRAVVNAVALRQTCTNLDSDTVDPTVTCGDGQNPLFSRPPLQVELTVDGMPLVIFVNHFKSKRGGEDETTLRRLAQAQHINNLVRGVLTENSTANIVVLGDFNDYDQSPSSQRLSEQLVDVLGKMPASSRYSFVFGGASQLIDGIYVSPSLAEQMADVTIMHINADYPDSLALDISPENIALKSSDHDLPLVVFNLDSTLVTNSAEQSGDPAIDMDLEAGLSMPSWVWLVIAGILGAAVAVLAMLFLQRNKKA
jgi:predicted extracellular nuclease